MNKETLENCIKKLGIEQLNEMQRYVSDVYDECEDILLLSPTGSGKTLAFLLPLLSHVKPEAPAPQALILTPSRELSLQIEDVCKKMQSGIRIGSCYGGHSAGYEEKMLENPPAILVGTPGRIKDHAERGRINLQKIETLILDEFDKCLEFGFAGEMQYIINEARKVKKKLLLSATEMDEVPPFAMLQSPIKINFLSETETLGGLKINIVNSPVKDKVETLFNLICHIGDAQSITFCNYRDAAERVASYLRSKGIECKTYHGGLEQQEREKALCCFRNGSCNTLIATDLAARGLDIPEVRHIIHYHLPASAEAYTHRNGRTARMYAEGNAYILRHAEEQLPDYIDPDTEEIPAPGKGDLPPQSAWVTLYIGKGKRDKLSKGDVAGFLMRKGNLSADELGKIEVKDHYAYAAVRRNKVKHLLSLVATEKIKGMKTIIEPAN